MSSIKKTKITNIGYGSVLSNKYRISKIIGRGSFGIVYIGRNINSNERIAVKFEKTSNIYRQLHHEYKVKFVFKKSGNIQQKSFYFHILRASSIKQVYQRLQGTDGIGKIHLFGKIPNYDYLVMELFGPSLESVFNYCNRKFTLPTTIQLGIQMVRILELVHLKKFIHRDVKPDNFVLGTSSTSRRIKLIDFGLAKRFIDSRDQHIACEENRSFTGTARYASINSLKRFTHSRRDDLESIGYILVYFLKGTLPWQNVRQSFDKKQRKEIILEIKLSTTLSSLCENLPNEIHLFLKYCRERQFDEQPNYTYLRKLLG